MSESNFFDRFSVLMDQNIVGVQYGVYAVAGLGFCIAVRSVKPFTRFCKPSDIPASFLQKRMNFRGHITGISGGSSPTLFVKHHPVISLPLLTQQGPELPIQISSLNVTTNGGIWLSSLLRGTEINFTPLTVSENAVHCIVSRKNEDVAEHLVSIGFATVGCWDMQLDKDQLYSKYYKSLLRAQKKAQWKQAGVWQERSPNTWSNLLNRIRSLQYSFA